MVDTMLGHQLLTLGKKESSSLLNVTRKLIDPNAYEWNLFLPNVSKSIRETFTKELLSEEQVVYAALDAYYTFWVENRLFDLMQREDLLDA